MYGILTYIWWIFKVNVGKYTIMDGMGKDFRPLAIPMCSPVTAYRASTTAVDLWSIGCVLAEMLRGEVVKITSTLLGGSSQLVSS